ncbi:hypothetical protein [Sphingomonas sp. Root720]|uniref:hypothetical protein n=1 Tax=Sphingomonas sp. Root720 TaxID=1736595 RepID=UPI0006F67EC3|nr:hypothetical protein [Sphingomonas sp. Root720]KRB93215.1 hypothetical protein ASE22_25570 [Sphingomonas sp. Root720]
MTFGYALLGALVLLLPGFAGYYGVRIGEANDLVSPRPDHPNSNQTIFLVVALALSAHVAGAILFAANEQIAGAHPWFNIGFDPNPYKMLLLGHVPGRLSSTAFAAELLYFFLLTIATGWVGERTAKLNPITTKAQPLRFGWLLPIARQVEQGSHIVIGYVMTTTDNDGSWLAYEGMVRRLALDDDDGIQIVDRRAKGTP